MKLRSVKGLVAIISWYKIITTLLRYMYTHKTTHKTTKNRLSCRSRASEKCNIKLVITRTDIPATVRDTWARLAGVGGGFNQRPENSGQALVIYHPVTQHSVAGPVKPVNPRVDFRVHWRAKSILVTFHLSSYYLFTLHYAGNRVLATSRVS